MGSRRVAGNGVGAMDPVSTLLVRAKTDPEAFGELYDRCATDLKGWFLRRTGSPHLAMELTAETFAQALAGVHRYDPTVGNGWGWLFGIATHQFLQLLRRGEVDRRHRQKLAIATPTVALDEVDRAIDAADAQQLLPHLQVALDGLSDGIREAVELRVGLELTYAEVAARLGVTEGHARVRVRRGLRQLATALVDR